MAEGMLRPATCVATDVLLDILTWIIVGSILGTRLVWVAGNIDRMDSVAEVFMIWHGGMTLYGGILGGLVAGVIMLRRYQLPVLEPNPPPRLFPTRQATVPTP